MSEPDGELAVDLLSACRDDLSLAAKDGTLTTPSVSMVMGDGPPQAEPSDALPDPQTPGMDAKVSYEPRETPTATTAGETSSPTTAASETTTTIPTPASETTTTIPTPASETTTPTTAGDPPVCESSTPPPALAPTPPPALAPTPPRPASAPTPPPALAPTPPPPAPVQREPQAEEEGGELAEESSQSQTTLGGSEDPGQSSDSADFSIPSLELSEGGPLGAEGPLGGEEGRSPSVAELPCGPGEAAAPPPPATGGATAAPEPSAMPAYYLVKWITWKEKKTPIITQSENGPCPLLAIMNTLFLRWKAKLPAQTEVITTEDLMAHLGECVLSIKPREKAEGMELNFQQNMSDAMAVLPKLSTGLDVNVRFTGVSDFEYTPECIVFDLLSIPLYHGWLVDPQSPETQAAVGKLSYNQLVEKIIDYKHSDDSNRVSEGLVAEQFLVSTATQLSYHGLCELNSAAAEGHISVFFRNNHFSTMIKHKGHLYLLVTDAGFLTEETLVWESLHNVEGDGNFCDSDFRLCHPPQRALPPPADPPLTPQQQQRQIDQDYLVAMSLQQTQGDAPGPLSDAELARQLQEEEYQQQQQQQQQQHQQQQQQQQQGPSQSNSAQVRGQEVRGQEVRGQAPGPQGARRREKDSDCVIL